MNEDWNPSVVYVRHTSGNKGFIEEHVCWNTERFIAAQQASCEAINGMRKKATDPVVGIEIVTKEVYRAEKWPGR